MKITALPLNYLLQSYRLSHEIMTENGEMVSAMALIYATQENFDPEQEQIISASPEEMSVISFHLSNADICREVKKSENDYETIVYDIGNQRKLVAVAPFSIEILPMTSEDTQHVSCFFGLNGFIKPTNKMY